MATAMQILSGPKHLQKTIVEEPAGQGSAASRRWGRWTCEAPLFANVAEQDHKNESMSWARWGAVKWVQNQPRALAANAYEAGVDEGESFIPVLKFETFWEMVRPCLCKEATKADVDAILKRATFLVNTKQFVYYLSFCSDCYSSSWPCHQQHLPSSLLKSLQHGSMPSSRVAASET